MMADAREGILKQFVFALGVLPAFFSLSPACPAFVEFLPDPTAVSDQEGEFIEIRLDDYRADSIEINFESQGRVSMPFPDADRILLMHDGAACPVRERLACAGLGKLSLPNTRISSWKLAAGNCSDSVTLPKPKAGMSLQRVFETAEWVNAEATPGYANPLYEHGVDDCGWGKVDAEYTASGWKISGELAGCDSSVVFLETLDLALAGGWSRDSLMVRGDFRGRTVESRSAWIRLTLPEDDYALNNVFDTLLLLPDASPFKVTEIHHCPEEPEPEWVELYNATSHSLPLSEIRFCDRGGAFGVSLDSVRPYETFIVTKDTLSLRSVIGFDDTRLVQVSLGFLNNASGFLRLCFRDEVIDSVGWERRSADCPSGFSPQTGKLENTPGFQGRSQQGKKSQTPFTYKVSSRVVRRGGAPLRVKVEGGRRVNLRLLDSAGRKLWQLHLPEDSNAWWVVPVQENLDVGVGYVSLSEGDYEVVLGILLRP